MPKRRKRRPPDAPRLEVLTICGDRATRIILGLAALWLAAALSVRAASISEDFGTNPAQRGWRTFGDASLFHWNSTNQNLEVTWDSSHTNSFFYLPLGTVLAKSDDFSFSFDLRVSDIRIGSSPGKSNTFEIAVGLLKYRSATNSKAFRGTGANSTYGVRNIVEFDYFPDDGFGATFATTVISTNVVFSLGQNFPLTLSTGATYRLNLSYTASNQVLHTSATKNGVAIQALSDVSLAGKPDLRVDAFGVTSYSDALQYGLPSDYGSILAHGVVDNVQLMVPPSPVGNLRLRPTNSVWMAEFTSSTNWLYTLEGSTNFGRWAAIGSTTNGNGTTLRFVDTNGPGGQLFYRIGAERP